ncbi:MAG: methyl-accepting chemotaxis protein [Anaeromyxobacteraceae bacterium]
MRLKLSTLVVAGLAASAFIAAFIAFTGVVSLAAVAAAQQHHEAHATPSVKAWNRLNDRRAAVARQLSALFVNKATLDERRAAQDGLKQAVEELGQARAAYEAHPHGEAATARWRELWAVLDPWLARVAEAAKGAAERDRLLGSGMTRTDPEVVEASANAWGASQAAEQGWPAGDAARDAMDPVVDGETEVAAHAIDAVIRDGRVRLATVAVIAAFVALAIGWWVRAKLLAELSAVQNGVGDITRAVRAGKLDVRADAQAVGPDFQGIVAGVNEAVEGFRRPIEETSTRLTQLARGEIPPPIEEEWQGDFDTIKAALNACTGTVNALVADASQLVGAAVAGQLAIRADASRHPGDFRKIVQGVNDTLDAVVGPLNVAARALDEISRGAIPGHITAEFRGDYAIVKRSLNGCIDAVNALVNDARALSQAAVAGELATRADASRHQGDFRKIVQGVNDTLDAVIGPLNVAARYVDEISRGAIPARITAEYRGDFDVLKRNLNTCIDAVNALVADANRLASAAVEGHLETRADAARHQGDFRKIVDGVNRTLDAVLAPITETSRALEALSRRDLTARVTGDYRGDHARIKDALNATAQALEDAMAQVASTVEQVSSAATQIASSSQAVASGASQQAGSLQETTASVESLSALTRHAVENAQQANLLAQGARTAADDGSQAVEQMQGVMGRIKASAEGTSQIIKDVSDIAFQTNLLALNAAVEAARAGEAGRGFAVVAEEVRSLALRAKEAATKTEELIRQSVKEAGDGETTAKHVAGKLGEIVGGIGKVTAIVSEISAAGVDQSAGIDGVTKAVGEMDRVTQQNAASAEESSSAASELSAQAEELGAMIASFQLTRASGAGARALPAARRPRARSDEVRVSDF